MGGRGEQIPSLRRLRVARALTQAELAERASVQRNTIARIEATNKHADLRTIRKLAEALGVEPSELMRE